MKRKKKTEEEPPLPQVCHFRLTRWKNDEEAYALLIWLETDADPGWWPPTEKYGLTRGHDFVFCVWHSPTTGREIIQGETRRSLTFLTANQITDMEMLTDALRDRLHMKPREEIADCVIVGGPKP